MFILWCFLTDEYWTGERWVFDKDRAKLFDTEKEASEYINKTEIVKRRFGLRIKEVTI
jgi:hypothetical protein